VDPVTRGCREYRAPWEPGWREKARAKLDSQWDLIIIGGGITGAGIMSLAARSGVRTLLLEKGDFAAGTSSRSSKMVHGGLRYLKNMHIKLTWESVRERQRLLAVAPGLIDPLGFIYPIYEGGHPSPWVMGIGLGIYTRLSPDAGDYERLDEVDIGMMAPGLKTHDLERGYHYLDAQTDDARLVLRVLHDGLMAGEGRSRLVINATGAWADELRRGVGGKRRLRPLRGSHLFFDLDRFPVYQAVAFSHPDDGRPVFAYPWEGVGLVGTTDIDHGLPLESEVAISVEEADYLLRAVQFYFPGLELTKRDVLTTQAGVRPVVDTGKADPSTESRDHVVWPERGLLTVTGGKLTTFRLIAIDALREAHNLNPEIPEPEPEAPVLEAFDPGREIPGVEPEYARRFWGRYGAAAPSLAESFPGFSERVPGTPYFWAELAWAAGHGPVCHLDDLLLRCFRLGILLPDGGQSLLPKIGPLVKRPLGWEDERWDLEAGRYRLIWAAAHGLPKEWQDAHNDHR
jgi:glycerol-3-phosphate dehydrogenase